MGWRIRKSINLGLGFRINLSKSGIGYSWGFPGYRTTKLANGGTRQTYSIPGTGISYADQQGKNKNNQNYDSQTNLITGETTIFENVPIEDITKNDPILKGINKARSLNILSNFLIIVGFGIFIHPAFILSFLIGLIMKFIISYTMKIKLYYEFDEENRKMYNSLKEIWISLSKSQKLWQVNSSVKVFNTKYNAGAEHNISRSSAYISNKTPKFIKTNIDIYGLNLQNQRIYFTPDRILVFKPFKKVFGCTYRDMFLGLVSTRFIESERVPQDAEIIDYTWKYTNKDGSRDLRFSNNRKYPICKYGELTLKSPNGIHTIILFSNHDMAEDIQSKLVLFGNQFNKILEMSNKKSNNKMENKEQHEKTNNLKKENKKKNSYNLEKIIKEGLKFDPLFDEVIYFGIKTGKLSASLLQRKFRLGYNRAARLIDYLEEKNIIGPANGSNPRIVLLSTDEDGE